MGATAMHTSSRTGLMARAARGRQVGGSRNLGAASAFGVGQAGIPSTTPRGLAISSGRNMGCIARASSTKDAPTASDVFQLQQTAGELRSAMSEAVANEDYGEAARLRDRLLDVESQDPVVVTEALLEQAIKEERYEDAAAFRDQLVELTPKPYEPAPGERIPVTSDTVTDGIRVRVRSFYLPERSMPDMGAYSFAYRVTIRNEGTRTMQLRNRHWVITDGSGEEEEVRGPGVVGEQPILAPGAEFEYTSASPMHTAFGYMKGEYEMVVIRPDGSRGETMDIQVGPFGLDSEAPRFV